MSAEPFDSAGNVSDRVEQIPSEVISSEGSTVTMTVRPKLAFCAGCGRHFLNVDGCDVCRTSKFLSRENPKNLP